MSKKQEKPKSAGPTEPDQSVYSTGLVMPVVALSPPAQTPANPPVAPAEVEPPKYSDLVKPNNHKLDKSGQRWTTEEINSVIMQLNNKKTIKEIAATSGRSFNSIQMKVNETIYKYYEAGSTVEELSAKLHMDKTYIVWVIESIKQGKTFGLPQYENAPKMNGEKTPVQLLLESNLRIEELLKQLIEKK